MLKRTNEEGRRSLWEFPTPETTWIVFYLFYNEVKVSLSKTDRLRREQSKGYNKTNEEYQQAFLSKNEQINMFEISV